MKYSYKKDVFKFIREEKKGYFLLVTEKNNIQVFINEVAKEVMDLIPLYNDTEDVFNRILNIYDIDEKTLHKDMKAIFDLFEVYGMIEFETSKNKNNKLIEMVGDESYCAVSKFIASCLKNKDYIFCANPNEEYYLPELMRYRVMQNREYASFTKDKFGNILCYMSVSSDGIRNQGVITVTNLFISESLNSEEKKMEINKIFNYLINTTRLVFPINKIRFMLIEDENSKVFVERLKKLGFECECVLKKEYHQKNLLYYTRFL